MLVYSCLSASQKYLCERCVCLTEVGAVCINVVCVRVEWLQIRNYACVQVSAQY
eukprot:m.356632 g.356632  ORF g.356632 m.356632 type:complete len:54 (+) comp17591_c0_seq1:16-177(+)